MSDTDRTIGRYEIRRELGRGMMGIVFLAHDPDLGRDIALKVIRPPGGTRDEDRATFEQRFFAEARSAARLSHPGIVVVHDVGRDSVSGDPFMALQLVPGRTLESVLREQKRLEPREAFQIARRVAEALHHAHGQGVVHRDIKPANIMILPSGEPMIMDFGIAKVETSRLTASGHFVGTPLYMSPEQAMVHAVDGRSDIFSLGSVLYEMLTGVPAFGGPSVTRILLQLIQEEPKAPSALIHSLSGFADQVLRRCLAKDVHLRYQTALQLTEDLSDLLDGLPPRSLTADTARASVETTEASAPGPWQASTLTHAPAVPGPVAETLSLPGTGSRGRAVEVGIALTGLALILTWWLVVRFAAPASPVPTDRAATVTPLPTPTEEPSPTPAPTVAPKESARLVLEFEHTLRTGLLRIFVDDEAVMRQSFDGKIRRRILGIPIRGGRMTETFELAPGRHTLRVQVSWDDNVKTEETVASFRPGDRLLLRARLGSIAGLRKNLSLDWN